MIFENYLSYFLIFNFIDILEILFFSSLIYYCSKWLKCDKQNNILISFYLILITLIASHISNMAIITNFLITFLPTILIFFFIVHQNTLQKNFIGLKKIKLNNNINNNIDWLEEFIRSCLNVLNNNKQITAIIEGNNILNEYLTTPILISADINKNFIDILLSSPSLDQNKMIWLSYDGKLQGINAEWNNNKDDLFFDNLNSLSDWQKNSIILTSKVDCLIFKTYPTKRTFDLIVQGRLIEDLSSQTLISIIQQFIKKRELKVLNKKKDYDEINSKKNLSNQPFA